MTDHRSVLELFNLTGRTALVTGATGHLGSALAQALAEAGATVIASSRSAVSAEQVAKGLPTPNKQLHLSAEIDQLDVDSAERSFDEAVSRSRGIDILINNAHEPLASDLTTVTAEQFDRQLANSTGYFVLARKLRDHAVARNAPGSVVMLGSMYGIVGSYPDVYDGLGPANSVAYQTLKGGVIQMTRHLAVYWAKDRVRVNCLSPGPFPQAAAPVEFVNRLSAKSPMGRIGFPHELKGAILLLASDAGSYITGQNIVVDGGWAAW